MSTHVVLACTLVVDYNQLHEVINFKSNNVQFLITPESVSNNELLNLKMKFLKYGYSHSHKKIERFNHLFDRLYKKYIDEN